MANLPDPNMSLEEMVKHIYTKVNSFDDIFRKQQEKIDSLEKEVKTLKSEVHSLKDTVNARKQDARSLNIRISGLNFTQEEKTNPSSLNKLVYDRVLLPIINLAKTNKLLDRTPTLANTITSAYRVRASSALTGTANPPPVVVQIATDQLRLAILQSKQRGTPPPLPNEVDIGIRSITVQEDLTPPTYKMLRDIKRSEEVHSAWTIAGRIRFRLTGSDRVHFVRSVFDKVDDIISSAHIKS